MNFQNATPMPGSQSSTVPPGWKAEWSAQYARYFYINLSTNESTWTFPAPTPHTQAPPSIQRKPVPLQALQSQALASNQAFTGAYPGTQLHTPGGYSTSSVQQAQHGYGHVNVTQQQQQQPNQHQQPFTPYSIQQQQNFPAHTPAAQDFSPPSTPGSYQEQQRNLTLPSATRNTNYALPAILTPHHHQHQQQAFGQPRNLDFRSVQQSNVLTPPMDRQQPSYLAPATNSNDYYPPPPPPPQQQHQPFSHSQAQKSKNTSTFGSSFMNGNMMTKMSSKLTDFQTSKPLSKSGPPPSTHPHSTNKAPITNGSDWKKWTKRAAIGVAAVGALALGVDAMDGGIFDGAAAGGGGGGGDFSGGDYSGGGYSGSDWAAVGDAQTSVDASAAQAAIEQQGQNNALMLADPAGTTYTVVDSNSLV